MQVCFVALPFQNIENPALSLSILQGCLKRENISSKIIYANLEFAELIGLDAYYAVAHGGSYRELLMGDFVFSKAAFGKSNQKYFDFMHEELKKYLGNDGVKQLEKYLSFTEKKTISFLESLADKVIALKPQIVACSSTTQQNCVCIAFFKILKKKVPHICTVMGGPNCERIMGKTIADSFPDINYVISGEADSFWGDFCRKLLSGQKDFPEYPEIFCYRKNNDSNAAGLTKKLDEMPYPDFDDYFEALERYNFKKYVDIGLLIETSRGCWWGEKHPCTFCGLNGASRLYRKKSSQRIVDEFRYMVQKYNIKNFFAVDCILARDFYKTVLPGLVPLNLNIMYEIKTNTSVDELKILKQAGINWVQPGIESLQDKLLQLMNKGNRAIKHIELLKNLTELNIKCCWLLLCAFPGEENEWYEQQLECMKLLTHLQPPDAVFRLRYDRFSVYEQRADEYGLRLHAARAYYYIYPPQYHHIIDDIAYFLEDSEKKMPVFAQGFNKNVHERIYGFVQRWQARHAGIYKDRLTAKSIGSKLDVVDLRHCAVNSYYEFTGCDKEVALTAVKVIDINNLIAELEHFYIQNDIFKSIKKLKAQKLLIQIGNEVLFLPLFKDWDNTQISKPPAGNVDLLRFINDKMGGYNE